MKDQKKERKKKWAKFKRWETYMHSDIQEDLDKQNKAENKKTKA